MIESSLEYIYKLFEKSAENLGVKYIKTTPTKLQSYANNNKPPFISLVGINEITNDNDNLVSYDCSFVMCASSDKDPSNEDQIKLEIEADKLTKRFIWYVRRNEKSEIEAINQNQLFRGSGFNGVGIGLSFSISVLDMNSYCDDWCNDTTKRLDCED